MNQTNNLLSIRLAHQDDLALLGPIEKSASKKFEEYLDIKSDYPTLPKATLMQALNEKLLWVLSDNGTLIGFVCARIADKNLHIEEFSIAYDYQGNGYGREFIGYLVKWAKEKNYSYISLTTDQLIPWNAPYYSKLGFHVTALEKCKPDLRNILEADKIKNADHAHTRIAMVMNF